MICPPWNDKSKDHIKLDILTIGPTHIDPMFELTGCMRVTKILSISGVRNSDFCICENKGGDQLCCNCTADQVLCFATWIVQSLNFLNPNFKSIAIFCGCTAWFVSDLVGNLEDRFSRNTAHIKHDGEVILMSTHNIG